MKSISVIIPIYNCGEQLRKAIDSIVNQTFRDFEIILVDDGSNDGITPAICEAYTAKHDYIKVLHGPNGGISAARNKGMAAATGEYLAFVDGDDEAEPDLLESLWTMRGCDFIISRPAGKDLTRRRREIFKAGKVGNLFRMMRLKSIYVTWGNLYKMSIIREHGLSFNRNLRLGEDTLFNYEYLACCDSLGYVPKVLYRYTGVWGGDPERYRGFGKDAIQYRLGCAVRALQDIKGHWGGDFPIHWRLGYLDHLDGRYSDYTDVELCRIFLEACPILTEEEFFRSDRVCMSKTALREVKHLWRKGKKKEAMELAHTLHGHFTKPLSALKLKPNYALMYKLIRKESYKTLAHLMPVLSLL